MQDELLSFLLCKIWEESNFAETEKPGAYYCSLLIQSTVTILVKTSAKLAKFMELLIAIVICVRYSQMAHTDCSLGFEPSQVRE